MRVPSIERSRSRYPNRSEAPRSPDEQFAQLIARLIRANEAERAARAATDTRRYPSSQRSDELQPAGPGDATTSTRRRRLPTC